MAGRMHAMENDLELASSESENLLRLQETLKVRVHTVKK